MLDKFLILLERFVVAHELIAANSCRPNIADKIKEAVEDGAVAQAVRRNKEMPVEGEDVIDTKSKAKSEPEDDLADDEEPEEKPKRKPRGPNKNKEEPKGPDLAVLRDEIKTMARHIAGGDSDKCADLFDELLDDYKVRTVTKLPEEDVEAFHKDAKDLVSKFYDVED